MIHAHLPQRVFSLSEVIAADIHQLFVDDNWYV